MRSMNDLRSLRAITPDGKIDKNTAELLAYVTGLHACPEDLGEGDVYIPTKWLVAAFQLIDYGEEETREADDRAVRQRDCLVAASDKLEDPAQAKAFRNAAILDCIAKRMTGKRLTRMLTVAVDPSIPNSTFASRSWKPEYGRVEEKRINYETAMMYFRTFRQILHLYFWATCERYTKSLPDDILNDWSTPRLCRLGISLEGTFPVGRLPRSNDNGTIIVGPFSPSPTIQRLTKTPNKYAVAYATECILINRMIIIIEQLGRLEGMIDSNRPEIHKQLDCVPTELSEQWRRITAPNVGSDPLASQKFVCAWNGALTALDAAPQPEPKKSIFSRMFRSRRS